MNIEDIKSKIKIRNELNNLPKDQINQKRRIKLNIPIKKFLKEKKNFVLDDSELSKNYNDSLKSPQSRRLYKIIESEFYTEII